MISVNLAYNGYVGLSTDTKPTEDVNNGSRFYEMDTQKSYMFNAEGAAWIEQTAEGGGGGGSTPLVVTLSPNESGSMWYFDKTWKEVHDAIAIDHKPVYFHMVADNGVPTYITDGLILTVQSADNGSYTAEIMINRNSVIYSTDTETGYPCLED